MVAVVVVVVVAVVVVCSFVCCFWKSCADSQLTWLSLSRICRLMCEENAQALDYVVAVVAHCCCCCCR